MAVADRGDVRNQRRRVRDPAGDGTAGYAGAQASDDPARRSGGFRSAPCRRRRRVSAAQSIPTDAHRNHGPIVRDDSSRTQPVSTTGTGRVEFGDAAAAALQAARRPGAAPATGRRPARHCRRPSSTVCQRPVPGSGSNTSRRSTGAPLRARKSDGRRRLVDTQRRDTALDESGDQTPWAATQIDRRSCAQSEHRVVELAVGMLTAQPSAHRQLADFDRRRGGPNTARRPAPGRRDFPACQIPAALVACTNRLSGAQSARTSSTSSTVSTSDNSATRVTAKPLSRSASSVAGAGVRARRRNRVQAVGHRRVGHPEHPPSAVAGQAEHDVGLQ